MARAGQTLTNVAGDVISASDATIPDFMNYFQINLMNPRVIVGAFIGAMAAFLFCGMTMEAVGRAAEKMVQEVRRQFREIAGILEGTGTPDYGRCVEISTRAAQHEMIVPSILAILIPIIVELRRQGLVCPQSLYRWRYRWRSLQGYLWPFAQHSDQTHVDGQHRHGRTHRGLLINDTY